ncbi:MAG: hypothetical protein AMJ43_09085 [Coxiella sp. DG_40]|nr:MAG: hypothetical protein AMJ43_09085 [Coxiella sp. DG_40]
MKKLILVSFCVLLAAGTTVFGDSYSVSGHVYYTGSGLPVSNATVTLTTWWPASQGGGSSTTNTNTDANGFYSTGWTLWSAVDCNNNLTASKSVAGILYKGGVTWKAGSSTETKNIYISSTAQVDPRIGCGTGPENFVHPGLQTANLAFAYDDTDSGSIEVSGFTAQLAFDPTKMLCATVQPSPEFSDSFSFVPGSGKVTVTANATGGLPVALGDIDNPTPLFSVEWDVQSFETASAASVVFSDVNSEFSISGEPNNPVLNRTDYLLGEPSYSPSVNLETEEDWQNALLDGFVRPMDPCSWNNYMYTWQNYLEEGNDYPVVDFNMPELYVYEGNGTGGLEPNDAGLVMYWGSNSLPDGNYASAWNYKFDADPDLRNCTITVTVTAPQFSLTGMVNAVSFAINDIAGRRRSWWWSVGNPPNPIQWNTPTTVTINTAQTGVGATTPRASGYANTPGFNLAQSMSFDVDENFQWIFGTMTIPPPGNPAFAGMWNYWHNLLVTKTTPPVTVTSKFYVKWSQRPVPIDANDDPVIFLGWDERSDYNKPPWPILADDWKCTDDRPVTDIHWWGSFIGWNQPHPPPIVPKAFHLGIWTDVPDPNPGDPLVYSHPNHMVWENYCDNWVWNFAGYDWDPHYGDPDPCGHNEYTETCFQFNQLLSQDEWFYQEPNDVNDPNARIYWLSVAPIYNPADYTDPNFYPWGWKTREHFFQDDAVRITDATIWPPKVCTYWTGGNPIYWPDPCDTWDLAFELTTNKPAYADDPVPGDLNADKIVNLFDLAILARNWLVSSP